MSIQDGDSVFSGSVAEIYHEYLTPLLFEFYSHELAKVVGEEAAGSALELAAGTGNVTRAMVDLLGNKVSITATDLNQPMMDFAQMVRSDPNVRWEQADATALPFDDGVFDVVVCQFSVMFFPDKVKAYSEALRVLRPGGRFVFSVWDSLEENVFPQTVERTLGVLFPDDPPLFMSRTPFGYFDIDAIAADVRAGGFSGELKTETVSAMSKAKDARAAAIAFCHGTPVLAAIESRDSSRVDHAVELVREAFCEQFGEGEIEGKMRAHVFSVRA